MRVQRHVVIKPSNPPNEPFVLVPTPFEGVSIGSALFFDYNKDGYQDIIIAGWNDKKSITKIYRNNHGSFKDIHAGLIGITPENGLDIADYDLDGNVDIAISGTRHQTDQHPTFMMYRNDKSTFTEINTEITPLLGCCMKWGDYDHDGDPDLFMCGATIPEQEFRSIIYRNDNGVFTDIHADLPKVWAGAADWGDYDNDGDLDLLMTGYDGGEPVTVLFRNDGNDTFTRVDIDVVSVNHGDVAWADYDRDGKLDFAITGVSYGQSVSIIYHNEGNDTFKDIKANIYPLSLSSLAWGDFDNDGYPDLAIAGVEHYGERRNAVTKIYHNVFGKFVDIGSNLKGTYWGSVTWCDFDNDGKKDLLISGGTTPEESTSSGKTTHPVTYLYKNNYIPTDNH